MLRVTLRGSGVPTVVLGSGETLLVGRDPHAALPEFDADTALRSTAITLPRAAPHVSRVVGEIVVGEEVVRLRWRGSTEAQLSSLFDAPGGARRVALTDGMAAAARRGREPRAAAARTPVRAGRVHRHGARRRRGHPRAPPRRPRPAGCRSTTRTAPSPRPRPGSNGGPASGTSRSPSPSRGSPATTTTRGPRRTASSTSGSSPGAGTPGTSSAPSASTTRSASVARMAFGPADDPFAQKGRRVQNVRFAVGRRAAEVRLVTADDLAVVEAARARGEGLNPERSTPDALS